MKKIQLKLLSNERKGKEKNQLEVLYHPYPQNNL